MYRFADTVRKSNAKTLFFAFVTMMLAGLTVVILAVALLAVTAAPTPPSPALVARIGAPTFAELANDQLPGAQAILADDGITRNVEDLLQATCADLASHGATVAADDLIANGFTHAQQDDVLAEANNVYCQNETAALEAWALGR